MPWTAFAELLGLDFLGAAHPAPHLTEPASHMAEPASNAAHDIGLQVFSAHHSGKEIHHIGTSLAAEPDRHAHHFWTGSASHRPSSIASRDFLAGPSDSGAPAEASAVVDVSGSHNKVQAKWAPGEHMLVQPHMEQLRRQQLRVAVSIQGVSWVAASLVFVQFVHKLARKQLEEEERREREEEESRVESEGMALTLNGPPQSARGKGKLTVKLHNRTQVMVQAPSERKDIVDLETASTQLSQAFSEREVVTDLETASIVDDDSMTTFETEG